MTGDRARFLGQLLIGLGVLAVLANTGIFGVLPSFIWVLALFTLGAWIWVSRRFNFPQRLIVYVGVGILATVTAGQFAGTAATGFIAMAFALVWLSNTRHWWALIPAGVLGSVSLIITLGVLFPRWDTGPLFLLGLAGTFTLLYLLPSERGGQQWALIPAVALLVVTVLANDPGRHAPGWLVPVALIGTGFYLLTRWRKDG